MSQYSFIETIKVRDGQFYNLSAHIERMQTTIRHFYAKDCPINISDEIVPENFRKGLIKCRILYTSDLVSVEFMPYNFKEIKTLTIVECDDIDYRYKSSDRSHLDLLYQQRKQASDIIIVKDSHITDTSYANLVFENEEGLFTPKSYLLNGTKRQLLISERRIREKSITVSDISNYSKVYLINAMIDIEDEVSISVSGIL